MSTTVSLENWLHTAIGEVTAGSPLVREGTSPTSWYTAKDNAQHVAYVGVDDRIHELFFEFDRDRKWLHTAIGDGSDRPLVREGTSPTSWYTESDNAQHVAYVGDDHRIHELFFEFDRGRKWGHSAIGDGSDRPLVREGTSPTSWYTTREKEKAQHVAYVGDDRRLHELFFRIGIDSTWHHNAIGIGNGRPLVLERTSPTSWYTTQSNENAEHVAYVGDDRRLHELFFRLR